MSTRRRRLAPEERRRELLEAALRVFRERPPDECRVEDITAEAATAKGNFYRYFDSFDDLVVAVRDEVLDQYRGAVEARMANRTAIDWWQVLDEEIDAFFDFDAQLGPLHAAVFHGPAAETHPIAPERAADTLIARLIDAGILTGAFEAVDAEITAPLIFQLLHSAADQIAHGNDPARVTAAAKHMIRGALRTPDQT